MEQLTYLLFLKMADERSKPPFNLTGESPSPILKGYDWPSLLEKDGDELFDHYRHTLEKLGAEKGIWTSLWHCTTLPTDTPAKPLGAPKPCRRGGIFDRLTS